MLCDSNALISCTQTQQWSHEPHQQSTMECRSSRQRKGYVARPGP